MFLFDTFLYFKVHYLIFPSHFSPMLNSCISIKKVYKYFESQSNTSTDSLSSHLCTIVMICKLKKLILKVSLVLKIYFIYTVYSYRMEIILLNLCCLFLLKKSITLYSGHFFQEPQVSAIDSLTVMLYMNTVNAFKTLQKLSSFYEKDTKIYYKK